MKTLKDLESFRLGKGQMNAVTGGYNCYIVWADDWSTDQIVVNEPGNESDAQKPRISYKNLMETQDM